MGKRVLLTGAFGNVGAHVLRRLLDEGHVVSALDVHSKATDEKAADLAKTHEFRTIWADLTDEHQVHAAVTRVKPEAVVHVAAIIAPTAYVIPAKAYDVNVRGTRHVIEAAEGMDRRPRFVFTSSYSVHGPRNPHKDLPMLTGDTPVAPGDNYGCHKVLGEGMLQRSELPWTIIRLPAVMSTDAGFGRAPEFRTFGFLLPPERREQAIHAADAGTALAHAVEADVVGRVLDIGGGEGWNLTAGELVSGIYTSMGLKPLPVEAYRMADPEVDESWYFEDWVDTAESQKLLQYQNHTLEQYFGETGAQGMRLAAGKLMSPLATRQLLKESPYYGKPRTPDPTPMKHVICDAFGLDREYGECPGPDTG
jgi:nucleoside-diphosphate-sugar epimerase